MTNTRRKSLISTWSYKAVNGQKGPLVTMKLGSFGMSTSHWYAVVALWFAPGAEEGHGTAQRARTYSTVWCQSRILPTGYKDRESCFAQLRPNAGRMSENGGHHANQRRKLALERCCQLFVRYLPLHM